MKKISLLNVTLLVTATLFGSTLAFANDETDEAVITDKKTEKEQKDKNDKKEKMVEQLMLLTETHVVPVAFAAFDKDKDGLISREEIDAGSDEKLKLSFNRFDIDQDGSLSEEEFKAAILK